jgi:tight adherence protein C
MLAVFLMLTGVEVLLFILSKNRYAEELKDLDEKQYRLKSFLPIGLYILESVKYSYTTFYDRKLLTAIVELSGSKHALFLLKVHWAGKIGLLLAGLLFAAFIGTVSRPDAEYAVFCALFLGAIVYISDKDLFEKVKKRRLGIQFAFPDFVNKLTLLINAGMTVTRAWERVTVESGKETPLYRELNLTLQDMKAGKPEHKAYEEFAKRCRIPEITRFITVVLQNLRKGNSELVPILRVFAGECWEMRKSTAKRFGEEASTRMLLPMMLMFIAILLIVVTPAILALRNI